MMQLCVDIGNSRTKWAVFEDRQLISHEVCENFDAEFLVKIFAKHSPAAAIYSSVKDQKAFPGKFNFIKLSLETGLPFTLKYKTPQTLG
ncbi:MAG TPA: hypothetical protein VEB42_17210, partial [Chitinophagaceae bacterium]|nr:hypothetical protein [Chitinophagaceae bacterium]